MGKKLTLYHSAAHPGTASVCTHKQCLGALRENFANAKLKLLFKTAVSDSAQAALLSMVPVVSPDDLRVLHVECMDIVINAAVTSKHEEYHAALLAAHKLVHLIGCSDEMFEALTNILQSRASCFSEIYGLEPPLCPVASSKRRSEERRVGKECTSWCRSRWSPYH